MTLWVISDTHFGDESLLASNLAGNKTARPFDTLKAMNECIADNWNDRIGPNDTVYHLGDVYRGDGWKMLKGLNGEKHLILGNHDDPTAPCLIETFNSITLWKTFPDTKTVLSHLPIDLSTQSGLGLRFKRNIHGHLHEKPAPSPQHICISIEQTDFCPVDFDVFSID